MCNLRLILFIGSLLTAFNSSQAQSLHNTSWKAFSLPTTDTVTLRFTNDSSALKSGTGADLLLSTFKLSGSVVTFHDYGGINACADLGSYHIKLNADTLILVIGEDPCNGRSNSLVAKKWIRIHP